MRAQLQQRKPLVVVVLLVSLNFSSYFFLQGTDIGSKISPWSSTKCSGYSDSDNSSANGASCAPPLPTNLSLYSSPSFLSEYLSQPCPAPPLVAVTARVGPQGQLGLEAPYSYWPPSQQICQRSDRHAIILYLVLGAGREGRERVRRMWGRGRVTFLLWGVDGQERTVVEREQEEHGDIIISDVVQSQTFATIHMVSVSGVTNLPVHPPGTLRSVPRLQPLSLAALRRSSPGQRLRQH